MQVSKNNDEDIDVDIRTLMLMLWRRKLVIVGMMLIGISLTIIALGFIQPRYSARSVVLIEDKAGGGQTGAGIAKSGKLYSFGQLCHYK